jgi:hypothetical protein
MVKKSSLMMILSTRLAAGVLILALFGSACAKKEVRDPLSTEAIRADLEERPLRKLYEEYESTSFTPPSDGLLTDLQLTSYARTCALAAKIIEINSVEFDEKVDSASREEDPYSRMATAFSAIGNGRNAATAPIRAAINLDLNPKEMDWVDKEIRRVARVITYRREHQAAVDLARREWDAEPHPYLREKREEAWKQATKELERWEQTLGDAEKANSALVFSRIGELSPYVRSLRGKKPGWSPQ